MSKTTEQDFLKQAKILVSTHHEKWDGSGYPKGLKGEEIPLQGRMMAIVDVYDALTSDRPYKKAFTHEEAVKIITEGKGTHFDPSLVDVFLGINEKFQVVAELSKTIIPL
jgi:putative two-component system response regulator